MMAVGRGVLERAKKTLVYVLRRLLTSCAVIIEEGGVGGSSARGTFASERFFCTPWNQNCFIGFIQVLNQLITQRMLYQLSTSLVPPSTNLVLLIKGTSEPFKMYLRLEARSIHSVFVMTFEAPKDSDSKLALS